MVSDLSIHCLRRRVLGEACGGADKPIGSGVTISGGPGHRLITEVRRARTVAAGWPCALGPRSARAATNRGPRVPGGTPSCSRTHPGSGASAADASRGGEGRWPGTASARPRGHRSSRLESAADGRWRRARSAGSSHATMLLSAKKTSPGRTVEVRGEQLAGASPRFAKIRRPGSRLSIPERVDILSTPLDFCHVRDRSRVLDEASSVRTP
jgi:hypothetical protein